MKNINILTTGLIATTLLFGCATGNKISKNGFGGSWGETAKQEVKQSQTESQATKPVTSTIQENEITDQPNTAKFIDAESKTVTSEVTVPVKTADNLNAPATKISKLQLLKTAAKVRKQIKNSNDVDNKLLLVILCIILFPWLAVLLYEGSITSNFWITLVLTILGGLPGIIYGLLVIFDVI